jgi:hypothetical protein
MNTFEDLNEVKDHSKRSLVALNPQELSCMSVTELHRLNAQCLEEHAQMMIKTQLIAQNMKAINDSFKVKVEEMSSCLPKLPSPVAAPLNAGTTTVANAQSHNEDCCCSDDILNCECIFDSEDFTAGNSFIQNTGKVNIPAADS